MKRLLENRSTVVSPQPVDQARSSATRRGEDCTADRETAVDGERLVDMLNQSRTTLMQATPAIWRMLLATDHSSL
jgi:hypothetical protein